MVDLKELAVIGVTFAIGYGTCLVTLLVGFALGRFTRGEQADIDSLIPNFYRSDKHPESEGEIYDDEFFHKAYFGTEEDGAEEPDGKFPSDDELDAINRHSNEGAE